MAGIVTSKLGAVPWADWNGDLNVGRGSAGRLEMRLESWTPSRWMMGIVTLKLDPIRRDGWDFDFIVGRGPAV